MDEKELARKKLAELVGSPIVFVQRGNAAIELSLSYARSLGKTELLLADQGGWITYEQSGRRLGFAIDLLPTTLGVLNGESLSHASDSCVLLINSLPAYAFNQPMHLIAQLCKEKQVLLINDATGSIGTPDALFGDVILGSFGKWKPLCLGKGGFITSVVGAQDEPVLEYGALLSLLETLPERRKAVEGMVNELKEALGKASLLPEHQGLVAIASFHSSQERESLIKLAQEKGVETTLCPRQIRVNSDAVCFEVKRKFRC